MIGAPDISRRAFILAATALSAAGCFGRSTSGRIRLAAGDPGGLYLAFAEILHEQLHRRYPEISVEVLATEGTVENLERLRAGDVDMGLALADVAERDRAKGVPRSAPLAVARVYENYLQVIVRKVSAIQHLSDLGGAAVSIGPDGSGAAAISGVLFEAAELADQVEMVNYRLREGLGRLSNGTVDALVWSGGVPTPAIANLHTQTALRMLDIAAVAPTMSRLTGFPYVVRNVPAGGYVPPGIRSLGVPDLLLCRHDLSGDLISAVVDVLATDAPNLVPPSIRGLQYLDTPSMIQTGLIPLHPAAIDEYRTLHG